jgi:hypothetical protein
MIVVIGANYVVLPKLQHFTTVTTAWTLQPLPVESAMANPQCRNPKRIPTRAWRELIKRAWDVDPLLCPKCGGQMRLISLIEEDEVIEKILRHLDLWEGPVRGNDRAPPLRLESEFTRESFDDDLPFGPDSYAE